VLHNERFDVSSSSFRAHGQGTVDYGTGALDLALTARLLEAPEGSVAGVSLDRIVGVDIPLAVRGSMSEPRVRPDVNRLLEAAARALSVQSIDASLSEGIYRVSLVVRIDAPVEDVAAVLTDYAAYRRLDPRIRDSAVLPSEGGGVELVRTVVRACAGFFCRNVERVERVERHEGELVATVVPERSELRHGLTRTTWQAVDEATDVTYQSEFIPDFWVPSVIGRRFAVRALKASTLELFDNVEKRARER
jgi:hypothetical protein